MLALRYLEWVALTRLYAKPQKLMMYKLYNEYTDIKPDWQQKFIGLQKKVKREEERGYKTREAWIVELLPDIGTAITSLDEFYQRVEAELKPKLRDKTLTQKKAQISRKEYQKQELGSAYIDNSELISAVKKACIVLADDQANDAEIKEAITVLENDYCAESLSDEQRDTLLNVIVYPYLKSLGRSGKIENALLNDKKKLAYFLLGHIKRKCKTDDTITLPIAQIKEWCGGDAKTAKNTLNTLVEYEAIEQIAKGKRGQHSRQAAIYRLLI
jgi:hypothetical protein